MNLIFFVMNLFVFAVSSLKALWLSRGKGEGFQSLIKATYNLVSLRKIEN